MITITKLLVAILGVVVGIVFGAIPGMTATMAVAVFLPLTYAYDLETALWLLLALYVGGISGGLIPAILINIPGTPSSITTTFDGYPMAKRGEGERALKVGIVSSFIGGIISLIPLCPDRYRGSVQGPDAARHLRRLSGRSGHPGQLLQRQQPVPYGAGFP